MSDREYVDVVKELSGAELLTLLVRDAAFYGAWQDKHSPESHDILACRKRAKALRSEILRRMEATGMEKRDE